MFINEGRKAIEMNTAEYKAAMTYGTEEYKALREIRNDYPNFRVVELKSKKVTTSLNNIKMPFIKSYVKAHGTDKQKEDYFEMSTAHVNEYGVYIPAQSFLLIKKWFFVEFPEVKQSLEDHDKQIREIYELIDNKIDDAQKKAVEEARTKMANEKEKFLKKVS